MADPLDAAALERGVREVLARTARLGVDAATLPADADLHEAGMSSRANVDVMLALEDAFDVEFPDELLQRSVFASVRAICEAVAAIRG